jgi:anaerobic ribonucleoside-triphosphate reductase activating protein
MEMGRGEIYDLLRSGGTLPDGVDPVGNIMAVLSDSTVNGPGERSVVWFQGCGKACPGCFNPESWAYDVNRLLTPSELVARVHACGNPGITLSGGDPLEQGDFLLKFLQELHSDDAGLERFPGGIIVYTGELYEEIDESFRTLLMAHIDILVDGVFVESLKTNRGLGGSSNQRLFWGLAPGRGQNRLDISDVVVDHEVEVHADDEDECRVHVTGFPINDRSLLRKLGLRRVK